MKKSIFYLAFVFTTLSVKAQDLIILKDGNEISAKVMEVNQAEIKYKKFDNPEGPSYSVLKSDVFMIRYKNGTKDIINTIKEPEQKVNQNIQTNSIKEITTKGTIEFGGNISFINEGSSNRDYSVHQFAFNPYVGFMLGNGFELGLTPGFVSIGSSESSSISQFNLFLAPSYNIKAGNTYPFFEFLVGYQKNYFGYNNFSFSGVGFGASCGVKVMIGDIGSLVCDLKYLNQSFIGASNNPQYVISDYNNNTLTIEIGARIFIIAKNNLK